jgi:hypothetical protein
MDGTLVKDRYLVQRKLGQGGFAVTTDRQPFNADSVAQLIALQLHGVRVKPQDLRPSLPEAAQECSRRHACGRLDQ